MKNKLVITLIVIIACLIVGAGYHYLEIIQPPGIPSSPPAQADPVIRCDTVFVKDPVKIPIIKYRYLRAKTDTMYRTVHDTVTAYERADLDTTLIVGGVDYGRLYLTYWNHPLNFFDMDFIPAPLPQEVITKTITVKVGPKWYEKKEVWAGAAALIGGIISEARKK